MKEFNSQICTTREQSERLLALGLKKETADMLILPLSSKNTIIALPWAESGSWTKDNSIPAWSLHRLIEICRIEGSGATLELVSLDQTYDKYIGQIKQMIKEGLFSKEYLEDRV